MTYQFFASATHTHIPGAQTRRLYDLCSFSKPRESQNGEQTLHSHTTYIAKCTTCDDWVMRRARGESHIPKKKVLYPLATCVVGDWRMISDTRGRFCACARGNPKTRVVYKIKEKGVVVWARDFLSHSHGRLGAENRRIIINGRIAHRSYMGAM